MTSLFASARVSGPLVALMLFPLNACGEPEQASAAGADLAPGTSYAMAPAREPLRSSPEFEESFRLVRQAMIKLPADPGGAPVRLTACAVDKAGNAYLGGRSARGLHVWTPGGELRRLPIRTEHLPLRTAALSWSDERREVNVLDVGQNRVLRYDSSGRLVDYAPLNGGQGALTLNALPGGALLVGGERWNDEETATLAAVYDRTGRLLSTFFPMDRAVHEQNMDVYVPVLTASAGRNEVLVAEPTSYTVTRLSPAGEVLGRFGEAPRGYLSPSPLSDRLLPGNELDTWLHSWTPLLFLHAADEAVFVGFKVQKPLRGYKIEVYGLDGRKRRGDLSTSRSPVCGSGSSIYFVTPVAPDSVELSAYEYVGT